MKIIITGATGMVGEGVLLYSLQQPQITEVLVVGRKPTGRQHAKLKELIIPDFLQAEEQTAALTGYDACFFCAGISSVGLDEAAYTRITYDTTLHFAQVLKQQNPDLTFTFVSGVYTDSTEKGKVMWARVKGRTENALVQLFPNKAYNFRPALMKPVKGQKNFRGYSKYIYALFPLFKLLFPWCKMEDIAQAMINAVQKGYSKQVLEVKDIKALAQV
jgi:nucleoside-diphosphate-sugar epimerase